MVRLSPILPTLYRIVIAPLFPVSDLNTAACGRLISRSFDQHEFSSLIGAISLGKGEGDVIYSLSEGDAQAFIDVIEEVRFKSRRLKDVDASPFN